MPRPLTLVASDPQMRGPLTDAGTGLPTDWPPRTVWASPANGCEAFYDDDDDRTTAENESRAARTSMRMSGVGSTMAGER